MGYAQTLPFTYIEIGGYGWGQYFDVTSVATTINLTAAIQLPTWIADREVSHMFVDAHFPYVYNNAGVTNYLDGGQIIEVSADGGANWYQCMVLPTGGFVCWATDGLYGAIRVIGKFDLLKQYGLPKTPATVFTFRWKDAKTFADSISFSNIQMVMRVS